MPYDVSQSTAASSAVCRRCSIDCRPIWSVGQESTMFDIFWMLPQTHILLSVRPHFFWHMLQWLCPVRKRFSDHWHRGRLKQKSWDCQLPIVTPLTWHIKCRWGRHHAANEAYENNNECSLATPGVIKCRECLCDWLFVCFHCSYNPDLTSDPYGEEGCIWSFNYFFYNRKLKRIVFFTCRATRLEQWWANCRFLVLQLKLNFI